MSLQQNNIARVQFLVNEYSAGRAEGYLAGCADDFKGSVLGGLIEGGDNIKSKDEFIAVMNKMGDVIEVSKFEPKNWRAVGDDVLFNVDWKFTLKETGKEVETTALVRKVVRNNMICEKYHLIDCEAVGKPPAHDLAGVKRIQELLKEYMEGRPEGYMKGCADDFKGSVFGGLIPGADDIKSKAQFGEIMGASEKYMEVKKFEPVNFRAGPNHDVMFNVNWQFVWKETGKEVETTAVVRKVLNADGNICEKYHMLANDEITGASPRAVIEQA